jgi:large repetitive protein
MSVVRTTVTPAEPAAFVNPPADITVDCDNIPTSGPDLDYTNNGPGACLFEGSVIPQQQGDPDVCGGTINYNWQFTDPCGNNISHIQTITVTPAPPVAFINPPADITVDCDNIPTSAPALDYTNNGPGACLFEGSVIPQQQGTADICGGTIIYNWQVTDPCGNSISHNQTITVLPAPPVAFINPPPNMNATCDNVPTQPGSLQYTNNGQGNCLIEGSVQPTLSGSYNECGGTISYTWSFTSQCGQTITHTQNINVQPAPVASFIGQLPQNTTVTCETVPSSAPPLSYSNNQSGNCLISGSVPAQQTGFYNACGGTIAFTWTFMDACGRTIQHQQVITVQPAAIAQFVNPPGPQTVSCDNVPLSPPPLSYSNNSPGVCGISGFVPAIQSGGYNSCGGAITYTWTFIDNCNRSISYSQNITVTPASDPIFVNPPADMMIDCGAPFPPPSSLGYTNNASGNCLILGSVDATVVVISNVEQQYIWLYTNPCTGNTITHTQNITQNPTPSIILNPDFAAICEGESFDLSTISVTDLNNTNPTITFHNGTPANTGNQVPSTIVSPFTNTTYYVLATNNFGCSDELSFDLFLEQPPDAGIDGGGAICFATPGNINLFTYLGGSPNPNGYWVDVDFSGVNISNPYNVTLAGFPAGTYVFDYVLPSGGACPDAIATVELELLPELNVDILDISCSNDLEFYSVLINTNGADIIVNVGTINDLGNNEINISDIPISESLSIVASNPNQFDCIDVTSISPPDCNCPSVSPPVNNGNPTICDGETIPELSVTVGPNETANWYDAPSGGTQLIMGSTTYTPTNIAGPGVYTYYVQTEDLISGCFSSVLTPVLLEVYNNPVGNDASLFECDDDNDGFVSFILSQANSQINSNSGVTFTYYETLANAQLGTNPLSTTYTNIETPVQVVYVVVTNPNGCTTIANLTLTVNPLPSIDVVVIDETCLGDVDGSVSINSPTAENYSLDGSNWVAGNSFTDLAAGNYTAYVEDTSGCISNLDFTVVEGLELILNPFTVICDNNGTASDETDDFYTISFTVENNLGIAGSFTLNDGTGDIGTYNYNSSESIVLPALGQSFTFTFTDDVIGCSIQQTVGPLIPCSTDCLISIDQLDVTCMDGGTPTDPLDDFYTITINASAINGAPNNTYNVLVNNVLVYNFPYDVSSQFNLPADGSTPLITVVDNATPACQANQTIGPLNTCSDLCVLNAVVENIVCDDQGTGNDSDDDTFTFELTVTGVNNSTGWVTDVGGFSGNYGETTLIGPFLIINSDQMLTIIDNDDPGCVVPITVEAPEACSFCPQSIDAGIGAILTCNDISAVLSGTSSEPGNYTWTGPNSFEAFTLDITVTEPGWYYLLGEYPASCSFIDSVLVELNTTLPIADAGDEMTITCQITEVTLNGSGSSNSGNTTFEWLNQGNVVVGTTPSIVVTQTGTYTLIVTDEENGCTATSQVQVVPDAQLPIANAGVGGTLTCEVLIAILDGSNSSTGSNINYEWVDENNAVIGNTIQVSVSLPGTYTLYVTNEDNQCEASASVEISEDLLPPNADAGPNLLLTCDINEVTLDGSSSSGIGSVSYEWLDPNGSPIGNTETIDVTEDGLYTLIITDSWNGCTASSEVEVTIDNTLPIPDAIADGVVNCYNQPVTLNGSGSTGVGALDFEWFDSSNVPIGTTSSVSVSSSGTYTLIITDAVNGCTAETTVIVDQNFNEPTAVAESTGAIDCFNPIVTLDGGNSTGVGTLGYEWLDGLGSVFSTSETVNVGSAGMYQLVVTDLESGCTDTATLTIDENPDAPSINITSTGPLTCDNVSVTLDGSGSAGAGTLAYEWQNGSGTTLGTTTVIDVTAPGPYIFIVTDTDNGCSAQQTIQVLANVAEPVPDAGLGFTLTCTETSATLDAGNSTGNGTLEFEWLDPNLDSIGNTETVVVSQAGIYTVIVTGGNGCTASDQVEVLISTSTPVADAGPNVTVNCNNSQVTLGGVGTSTGANITYQWLDENNVEIGTDINITLDQAGTYTLVVTNTDNDCVISDEVVVDESLVNPLSDAGVGGTLTCDLTSISLGGSGTSVGAEYTYQWQNSANQTVGSSSTLDVTNPDTYTLIVTNTTNGCTAETEVIVLENVENPVADAGSGTTLNCTVTSATLDAGNSTGNSILAFEWLDANNDVIATTSSTTVTQPGTYTVIVTSDNGCTDLDQVIVLISNDTPVANAGPNVTIDCNNSQYTLGGAGTSTGANITYQWLDANNVEIGTGINFTTDQAGTYTLIVTNSDNNCVVSDVVIVDENILDPNSDAGIGGTLTCDLTSITLGGPGTSIGTEFNYQWQNSANQTVGSGSTLDVSTPDTYTLIVTNSTNGCTEESEVIVLENIENPVAEAGPDVTLNCTVTSAILNAGNSTGNSALQFTWLDPNTDVISNTATTIVVQPGIYTVIVTSNNGCTDSDEVEIFISNDTPAADAGPNVTIDCNNDQFTLGGNGTSTGANISYQWFDQNNIEIGTGINITLDQAGTYTLVVTNTENNCEISDEVIVAEDIVNPISDAGLGGTLTCDVTTINIGGAGTSTGSEYSYVWQNSINQPVGNGATLDVTNPDTYTLIVTNTLNGCTSSSDVIILENIVNPVADAGQNAVLTCGNPTIVLDGSNSSGNNISYEWFDETPASIGQTATIQVDNAGTYTLVVTNGDNGCTAESIVVISQDNNLPEAIATVEALLTCTTTSVVLDGSTSTSQNGTILYEWYDINDVVISTTATATATLPGTYTLVVTDDVNGCTATSSVEVLQDINPPTADAGDDALLTCDISVVQLQGSGANGNNLAYEWFDDNNISVGVGPIVDVNSTGIYTLIVTNTDNGCTASSTAEVVPDVGIPIADAGTGGTLNCIVDDILLDGGGSSSGTGITYEWYNSSGILVGNDLILSVSIPGVYTLIVTDVLNDCASQDNVVVNQNIDIPTAFIDQIGALNCTNQSLVLDGSGSAPFGDLSFEWSANPGNISSGGNTPNPEIDEPGTYILLVTNQINGCTNQQSITIVQDIQEPTVIINTPQLLTCLVTEVQLNAGSSSSNGNFEYTWTSNPPGGISGNDSTLNPTVNQPGIYTLNILNLNNGCESDGQIVVNQNIEQPTAIANIDDELDCVTDVVTIDGSGSSTGSEFIYQWTGNGILSGANTLQPDVNVSGTYLLTVTNLINGCIETTSVFLDENTNVPTGMDILMSPPPCYGDPGTIEIVQVQGGEEPYLYSIDNGLSFFDFSVFNSLSPGNYDVIVQDAVGCEYGESIFIPETPELIVEIGPEILITLGESGELQAIVNIPPFMIDSVVWTPADGLSCTNCLDPTASPFDNTLYTVTVTNLDGCTASDQILLRVRKDRDVFIPNVFSPNGDGFNDLFMIFAGEGKVKNIEAFKVFDRWGELVFEDYNFQPNDPAHSWDGMLRGELMNPAVFVYWAKVTFVDDETILFKGDVTLAR